MARSVKGRGRELDLRRAGRAPRQVAEMVIEGQAPGRAQARCGDPAGFHHRLARAYNTVVPSSGKVLTGGVDANALQRPKRFFRRGPQYRGGRLAHHHRHGLIDTGSRMDEVIFEEFKGTGNSKSSSTASSRTSGPSRPSTSPNQAPAGRAAGRQGHSQQDVGPARILMPMGVSRCDGFLVDKLKHSKTNSDFFQSMNQ